MFHFTLVENVSVSINSVQHIDGALQICGVYVHGTSASPAWHSEEVRAVVDHGLV